MPLHTVYTILHLTKINPPFWLELSKLGPPTFNSLQAAKELSIGECAFIIPLRPQQLVKQDLQYLKLMDHTWNFFALWRSHFHPSWKQFELSQDWHFSFHNHCEGWWCSLKHKKWVNAFKCSKQQHYEQPVYLHIVQHILNSSVRSLWGCDWLGPSSSIATCVKTWQECIAYCAYNSMYTIMQSHCIVCMKVCN